MSEITFVANTGIQYLTLKEHLMIDVGKKVIGGQYYYERQIDDRIILEPLVYFPNHDKYVRRTELQYMGYFIDLKNNVLVDESQIDFSQLSVIQEQDVVAISNLMTVLNRVQLLEKLENEWLPMPMYDDDAGGIGDTPTNWCRIKLMPVSKNGNQREYKVVVALDTTTSEEGGEALCFHGEPYKRYSLCGISNNVIKNLNQNDAIVMRDKTVPMVAYSYCDIAKRPWINEYLKDLFFGSGFNLSDLPQGNRLKYLAYYIYFISTLKELKIIPDIKVFPDVSTNVIDTILVVDIGNSRTFGLISELPIASSFSNVAQLELCDLKTGEKRCEPFDMRLAFSKEQFGGASRFVSKQFVWPSVVRLGKEASRLIYEDEEQTENTGTAYSYYSSPKRFLWDDKCYKDQWEYIMSKSAYSGGISRIDMEGIVQQFKEDGSFAQDPKDMGVMSTYSRRSLMTFCFIEILLHARMQANSLEFREKNGQEDFKRVIKEIIVTCPTTMARQEQIALRRAALEAYVIINRYYKNTYMTPYNLDINHPIVDILPSVRDLMLTMDKVDMKRTWNFDEATCCQMVYMYAESKRYKGRINEFFNLYSKKPGKPLVVGSLDIGAGTSDMMICSYERGSGDDNVVTPSPLYGESFIYAGDDILKGIIREVVIETNNNEPSLGIISKKLHEVNPSGAANIMNLFFTDPAAMGVEHRKMRSKFNIEVSLPIAQKYLELLRTNSNDTVLSYEDIFNESEPATALLDYFKKYFGFSVKDLKFPFKKDVVNNIIRKDIERHLQKWTSIFSAYKCDIVLLGGRPCSLPIIEDIIRQFYPVAPNRLISMNNYRVGNWYPGTDGIGHFGDRKSLVAVGALISDLASKGQLPGFKLNVSELVKTDVSSSNYLMTDPMAEPMMTPELNYNTIYVRSLPIYIYSKQLNIKGFPWKTLYKLDINEDNIRKSVANGVESGIDIENEVANRVSRIRNNSKLEFSLERDYFTDKESLKIDSVYDSNGAPVSKTSFELHPQSVDNEGIFWLDSGIFKVNIK